MDASCAWTLSKGERAVSAFPTVSSLQECVQQDAQGGEEQHQTVLESRHSRVHMTLLKPELCLGRHTSLAPFLNTGWRAALFEAMVWQQLEHCTFLLLSSPQEHLTWPLELKTS